MVLSSASSKKFSTVFWRWEFFLQGNSSEPRRATAHTACELWLLGHHSWKPQFTHQLSNCGYKCTSLVLKAPLVPLLLVFSSVFTRKGGSSSFRALCSSSLPPFGQKERRVDNQGQTSSWSTPAGGFYPSAVLPQSRMASLPPKITPETGTNRQQIRGGEKMPIYSSLICLASSFPLLLLWLFSGEKNQTIRKKDLDITVLDRLVYFLLPFQWIFSFSYHFRNPYLVLFLVFAKLERNWPTFRQILVKFLNFSLLTVALLGFRYLDFFRNNKAPQIRQYPYFDEKNSVFLKFPTYISIIYDLLAKLHAFPVYKNSMR